MARSANAAQENAFEFAYSDKQFRKLADIVYKQTGITLKEDKKQLTYSRFAKQIRRLGLKGFNDYIAHVESGDPDILHEFISAITTNFTSFFREDHHFEFLADLVKNHGGNRSMNVWSSACSTGEEPYSIAMTMLESMDQPTRWNTSILATDLDPKVVETARNGIYAAERINGLNQQRKSRFFLRGKNDKAGMVKVKRELSSMIRFGQLNLMHQWNDIGEFDIIFCRNVMIYFSKETQAKLIDQFKQHQKPGSYLFIGHSETINNNPHYKLVGKTIYQRQ